jgi:hypothetical protein
MELALWVGMVSGRLKIILCLSLSLLGTIISPRISQASDLSCNPDEFSLSSFTFTPSVPTLAGTPSSTSWVSHWTQKLDFPSFRNWIRLGTLFQNRQLASVSEGGSFSLFSRPLELTVASAEQSIPDVISGTRKLVNSFYDGSFLQAGAWQLKVGWPQIGVSLKF